MHTNSHVGGHGAQGKEIAMLKLSQKGLFGCYSADFLNVWFGCYGCLGLFMLIT